METQVLVIGGGPVGLLLALDLAQRGVQVTLVEQRTGREPISARCNHISSRTMESLRRLGLSRAVRSVGLPDEYPNDIAFRTTMTGLELARIPIPCRSERYTSQVGPDTGWATPEPPHRANQMYFEPVLYEAALATPGLTLLRATRFDDAQQGSDGVIARVTELQSGRTCTISAQYMVGCDGGRSLVRQLIGGKLIGDAVIQRVQSTLIDAPGLLAQLGSGPAWMNYNYNPRRSGTALAIDGERLWLVHNYLLPDEEGFESVDRDSCIRLILGVDKAFPVSVVAKEDWIGRRLVADTFRDRRIFIAGDAAHLWVPYAGYGMNAGIADALNLSWLLAAHLAGWAPSSILDAYEAERKPITEQVSRFAMNYAQGAIRERNTVPAEIEELSPAGERARRSLGESAYARNVQQFACGGLNFGYFYDASPIIVPDGESAPAYTMHDYTPSTVPGCRAPHFWLADGRSVYDLLGPGYTLLQFDPAADLVTFSEAAAAQGMPLSILPVDRQLDAVPECYRHALTIVRPDAHVAFRGDRIEHPQALVDALRGAAAG